jgi:hypothetical protein
MSRKKRMIPEMEGIEISPDPGAKVAIVSRPSWPPVAQIHKGGKKNEIYFHPRKGWIKGR